MMERRHWHDAQEARRWLQERSGCSAILSLLLRLPLLDIRTLHQLAGQQGSAATYRSVGRLQEAGLISSIQPPIYSPNSPHLFYLTDLGLATIGLDRGGDPRHLAQQFHLRASDVLKLMPTLRHLLDAYELLGALARFGTIGTHITNRQFIAVQLIDAHVLQFRGDALAPRIDPADRRD